MQNLQIFCLLIVFLQLCFTINGVRWFGFRNKEEKDDKDDCEPEIVAIRKTKVLPIAVPVFNKKRVYSVKTRKLRKNEENDGDAEQDRKSSEDAEESDQKEEVEPDKAASENVNSTNVPEKSTTIRLNERAESSNEKPVRVNLQSVDQELLDPDDGSPENADYETDELIKRAIEDDDEDIEELMSNDDL